MPNTKSAMKNVRKSRRKQLRNQAIRSKARTAVRNARLLIAAGEMDQAREAVRAAGSALDKAAQKGVIHKNNAARRKSRLTQRLNQALQAEE